jgi:hypothetical protein
MRPNKQVSPVIRISQGERDASARATHLEAATRKFLVTTNERKQMSTKTNFKRIALVAVAALGLSVVSSVPSQAVISGTATLTVANGNATKVKADSTTAATVTLKFTATEADTWGVTAYQSAGPATNTTNAARFYRGDTATSFTTTNLVIANTGIDSVTATTGTRVIGAAGVNSATLLLQLDSLTARSAGTYTYTVSATPFTVAGAAGDATKTVTASVSITVAAVASESLVASAGTSTAFISTTSSAASGWSAPTSDSVPSVLATASTTPRAYIYVNLRNTESVQASESVTITTNIGSIGKGGVNVGKSVTLQYASGGAQDFEVYSDGTAGTATITVKSASVTFANKTVIFYASAPATIVASVATSVIGAGDNTAAITAVAKDANGNIWGGTLYEYSSNTSIMSDSATACSYVAANSRHECTITGVAAGTGTITLRNTATTDQATTVSSNAVSMTVSTSAAATVKLAWDKATYAPGEKATLVVTVLDSAGNSMPPTSYTNLFAAGGISLSTAGGSGSDTLTAVSFSTISLAANALGTNTTPLKAYTVYMPAAGGTVKATATGGTALPLAGQVAVSASATVTDSAAAALAAVNALATTVASLRTLITTLTNLVLKIQKKVKA